MSEVKFNLVDSQSILVGTVHGSIGDLCVAALAAEPETIAELEIALQRFDYVPHFQSPYCFSDYPAIDDEPYDAGILIIDLAARVVVCNSTYSLPGPQGKVEIYDRQQDAEIPIFYSLPDDWLFLNEVECYQWARAEQLAKRSPPLDARAILYGRPLLEFLATNLRYGTACCGDNSEAFSPAGAIHAQWLLTPRADLRGQSPREVMLAKLNFIDQDLEFRAFQWSLQLEGPPCLPKDSYAYRYAGFGIHEWVIYYYLIRHLLANADPKACDADFDFEALVMQLEQLKEQWLNSPSAEFDNRIPAIIIDNERKRLPEAMGGRSMVIDEDCPLCKMMGDECEAGREVCFWHLDGCNMENHFAFSTFLTEQEYVDDQKEIQELAHRADQRMKDLDEHITRGEPAAVASRPER
jgi:hypothetical protein